MGTVNNVGVIPGYAPGMETCTLINRTGAALVEGDLVSLNLDFASTSGQAMVGLDPSIEADGATGYVFSAAVAVSTARAARVVLVSMGSIADNAAGKFGVKGIFNVKVDTGNKGEFIVAKNAAVNADPLTVTELQALTTGLGNLIGITLEDTTGVQVAKCMFNGEAYRAYFGGDT